MVLPRYIGSRLSALPHADALLDGFNAGTEPVATVHLLCSSHVGAPAHTRPLTATELWCRCVRVAYLAAANALRANLDARLSDAWAKEDSR